MVAGVRGGRVHGGVVVVERGGLVVDGVVLVGVFGAVRGVRD